MTTVRGKKKTRPGKTSASSETSEVFSNKVQPISPERAKERLLNVLDSLQESVQFCVSGQRDIVLPGLVVEGVGELSLPIQVHDAKRLIDVAQQAPYGRGEDTIVDTGVRKVWQLEPTQFSLLNPRWSSFLQKIVDEVQRVFAIKQPIRCELYKLLVYEKGSFFIPHRDTEKLDGMFATLVIALPSRHEGGALVVQHGEQTVSLDFGGEDGAYSIQYAAFYADCKHEIKPVREGYRVTLIYNLTVATSKQHPQAPNCDAELEEVKALLPNIFEDESINKIAIPFVHQYTQAGLHPHALKGADCARLDVLTEATQALGYQMYLALFVCHQEGSADDDTFGWSRSYRRRDDDGVDFLEINEEEMTLSDWYSPDGTKAELGELRLLPQELVSEGGYESFASDQQVHEATGNEGVSLERWYRNAVVVLWPEDRLFRILAQEGQKVGVPELAKRVAARKDKVDHKACCTLAQEIIDHWKFPTYSYHKPPCKTTEMLHQIHALQEVNLLEPFLTKVLPIEYEGTEGDILRTIGHSSGWDVLEPWLTTFFSSISWKVPGSSLQKVSKIFRDLCSQAQENPSQHRVCIKLAQVLIETVKRWDQMPRDERTWRKQEPFVETFTLLFEILSSLETEGVLEQYMDHVLGTPKVYDMYEVLIPGIQALHAQEQLVDGAKKAYKRLLQHTLDRLESLTAKPIPVPSDWAQKIKIKCSCEDCQELQTFLHSATETVHNFRRIEAQRRHLQQTVSMHNCDLDLATIKRGSPHTLVCTKNRASYLARCKKFEEDKQHLASLQEFHMD